jgi:hypothetical protein
MWGFTWETMKWSMLNSSESRVEGMSHSKDPSLQYSARARNQSIKMAYPPRKHPPFRTSKGTGNHPAPIDLFVQSDRPIKSRKCAWGADGTPYDLEKQILKQRTAAPPPKARAILGAVKWFKSLARPCFPAQVTLQEESRVGPGV